jgi:hypothetical protein
MYEQYFSVQGVARMGAGSKVVDRNMGWITRCSKSRLICKSLIALVCMLSTSGAMAVSYFIVDGYENTAMCQAVRKALSDGMVLDAEQPLCERRFELRPQAKSLGLSGIEKRLLPPSSYMGIWLKMAQVEGGESMPPSDDDKKRDEIIITKNMKIGVNKIYESHFDVDNSGEIQKVYISDSVMCNVDNLSDYYPDDSVTTYIVKEDGTLDAQWGIHAATAGIPFIFKGHTYYVKWESLKGSPDKNMLAQLDVFDAVPFHPELRNIVPGGGFTPPYCKIYSHRAR